MTFCGKINPIITFFFCLTLMACNSTTNTDSNTATTFFDLKGFFQNEVKRLSSVQRIEKTVTINDQVEKQIIENPNWEQAFSIFTQSDINKSAWLDKYRADTTYHGDKTIANISYNALEEDLKTRELNISFEDQKAQKVYVLNVVNNPILSTRQELTYDYDIGYHVKSWQKQAMAEERNLKIDVVFQK